MATLIVSIAFPSITETFATTPLPEVLVLSKLTTSPTLYKIPPVSIPILSTEPGLTDLISIVWDK